MSPLSIVLLILLLLLITGVAPVWPHAAAFGPGPISVLGVVLLIVVVLVLAGKI